VRILDEVARAAECAVPHLAEHRSACQALLELANKPSEITPRFSASRLRCPCEEGADLAEAFLCEAVHERREAFQFDSIDPSGDSRILSLLGEGQSLRDYVKERLRARGIGSHRGRTTIG
jgi:hypothetical protein